VIAGDRVLVKNQGTGANDGIYVAASGAWTRATDADTSAKVTSGLACWVSEGTANADTQWVLTTADPIVLATTPLVFAQFGNGGPPSGTAGGDLTGSYPNPTVATNAVTNAKAAQMANATIKGRTTAGTGNAEDLTAAQAAAILGTNVKSTESLIIACSDETTALTAGNGKITFRMPYAFTVSEVRASLTTAQTSGSIFTVDFNESGTTIFSTTLTIDNTEKTSTTAATPAVISDTSLADDAEITIDIDQIGDGSAKGLKVCLIGTRT
jgi:phage-related tail fiber protein